MPERLSAVPAPPRTYQTGPWEKRWSETQVLTIACANGATEVFHGKWIHQPFKVRAISMFNAGAFAPALWWQVAATSDPIEPTAADTENAQGLLEIQTEGTSDRVIQNSTNNQTLTPDLIISNVPTRLRLTVTNTTGAAAIVTVAVDLCYLTKDCPYDRPTA
jgi:hypothetical protein